MIPTGRSDAFWGGFDPIIFDPRAFTQHVQQVQQMVHQVAAVKEQIQNQLKSLADLAAAAKEMAKVKGELTAVRTQFDSALYGVRDSAAQLASWFPQEMTATTPGQYSRFQQTWTQEYRAALEENRRLQNAVYGQMADVRQQVASLVQASNSAPGEKAAVQAHNELLANLSGELAKLQALRVSRLRTKAENLARRQSEAAYGAAQGQAVLQGMGSHAPAKGAPINDVFVSE
jgi:P-type conjugative transfer protein TrbJ